MLLAPSATATARSTSTCPRSYPRRRFFVGAMAADSAAVSPRSSARSHSRRPPTWLTTPLAPVVTDRRGRAEVAFTLEVPFWVGDCAFEQQQFPLPGGLFRGIPPAFSSGLLNGSG